MKIMGLIVGAGMFLLPATSYAREWIVEDVQAATCEILPWGGATSPYDVEAQLRSEGTVPTITETNNPDGSLATVTLTTDEGQNDTTEIEFFTSMDGCQDQLASDIKDGIVTDPNSLR